MKLTAGSPRLAAALGALAVILAGTGTAIAGNIDTPAAGRQDLAVGDRTASAARDAMQSPEAAPAPPEELPAPGALAAPLPMVDPVPPPLPSAGPPPVVALRPPAPVVAPAPSSTSTTSPPPPTPAAQAELPAPPPPRWATISPEQGTNATLVTVSGGGCVGEGASIRMFITLPDGMETSVYGGAASPDGTWSQAGVTYPHDVPGRYTFVPKCVRSGTTVLFAYQPVFFSMAAPSAVPTSGGPPPTSNLPVTG